jgi:putative two-component system response regulator
MDGRSNVSRPRGVVRGKEKPALMLLEDAPENPSLLDDMLHEEGYRVLTFRDGKTAIEAATDCPPDLVPPNARMPGLDGFEVCRRFR